MVQGHPDVVGTEESYAFSRITNAATADPAWLGWARLYYGIVRGRYLGRRVGLHRYVDQRTMLRLAVTAKRQGGDGLTVANRVVRAVFDTYFVRSGGRRGQTLVEKTPWNLRIAERILDLYPDAKMVEVLRDGRDVCVSMDALATREDWLRADRVDQIREWVEFAERGIQLRNNPRYRDRVVLVRYEELRAAPERELRRLFEFLGLPGDGDVIARIVRDTDFSREEVVGTGHHARKGVVGDWRNHFTDEDERVFFELAGDTFRRAGYLPEKGGGT